MSFFTPPIDNASELTDNRFNLIWEPIQKTSTKESDLFAFVANPFLDYFVLDSALTLNMSINLFNAYVSLLTAAYIWSKNQQKSDSLMDKDTVKELNEAGKSFILACHDFRALVLNFLLSSLSLITRPIASIIEATEHTVELSMPSYS